MKNTNQIRLAIDELLDNPNEFRDLCEGWDDQMYSPNHTPEFALVLTFDINDYPLPPQPPSRGTVRFLYREKKKINQMASNIFNRIWDSAEAPLRQSVQSKQRTGTGAGIRKLNRKKF
ncbi:hypothetical protein F5887DRAFT_1160941 [Amanita rubescens]|nr:hypothetical protein F5887DRAFT_1160941 [Amanita rubescens]